MAKIGSALRGGKVRPIEPRCLLQKQVGPQSPVAPGIPGKVFHIPADLLGQECLHPAVAALSGAIIPQPQGTQDAPLRQGQAGVPNLLQIFLQISHAAVPLVAVEGDTDLVQRICLQQ